MESMEIATTDDGPEATQLSEATAQPTQEAEAVVVPVAATPEPKPCVPVAPSSVRPTSLKESLRDKYAARCNGVQLRDAKREKANQDLLYRSEYLATLVSKVAAVETSPLQMLQQRLAASPVPDLIFASSNVHHARTACLSRVDDKALASSRPNTAPELSSKVWGLETPPIDRGRAAFARGTATKSRCGGRGNAWAPRSEEDPLARYFNVWEGYSECTPDLLLQTSEMLHDHLGSEHKNRVEQQGREFNSIRAPNPLDMLKIPLVPGLPRSAFYGDHAEAAEMEVARHGSRCRHVARLKEGDMAGTSDTTLCFARHYWSNRTREEDLAERGQQEPLCRCFQRADGHDNRTGTHKFSLMECGSLLVRQEGRDPFNSHALVTMDQPVQVLAEGHYFEIQVVSLFRSAGRPDRPKELSNRQRTEGLIIGMTTTPPSDFTGIRSATDVPRAWCVATSGKYYATDAQSEPQKRPMNQERVRQVPSWHRKEAKSEQLRCPWPPTPRPAGAVRQKLDWSVALGEGDTLGMMITSFGGIVVTVNGQRQLFLPDAGVPMGSHFYPLVEAYNHVRSVRALPGALPPK